jgi:predicted CoA-substrate-specific enzyme activase
MSYFAGIDLGSGFVKAVIMEDKAVIAFHVSPMGGSFQTAAEEVMREVLKKVGLSFADFDWTATTGYGSNSLSFPHRKVSPLSANAKGINFFFPGVRTAIDVGTQQSSVVKLDSQGNMIDHVMSERCAAGSGWLLKVVARVLQINLEDLGPLSLKAEKAIDFTTDCAVFAETEVVSRISEGTSKEDILGGVHKAMALKITSLVERIGLEEECALIGGGAKDIGLVKSLAESLGVEIKVPDEPQLVAALGAILFFQP